MPCVSVKWSDDLVENSVEDIKIKKKINAMGNFAFSKTKNVGQKIINMKLLENNVIRMSK